MTVEERLIYQRLAPYVLSILEGVDGSFDNVCLVAYPRARKKMLALGLIEETNFPMRWRRTEFGNRIISFHRLVKEILDTE